MVGLLASGARGAVAASPAGLLASLWPPMDVFREMPSSPLGAQRLGQYSRAALGPQAHLRRRFLAGNPNAGPERDSASLGSVQVDLVGQCLSVPHGRPGASPCPTQSRQDPRGLEMPSAVCWCWDGSRRCSPRTSDLPEQGCPRWHDASRPSGLLLSHLNLPPGTSGVSTARRCQACTTWLVPRSSVCCGTVPNSDLGFPSQQLRLVLNDKGRPQGSTVQVSSGDLPRGACRSKADASWDSPDTL